LRPYASLLNSLFDEREREREEPREKTERREQSCSIPASGRILCWLQASCTPTPLRPRIVPAIYFSLSYRGRAAGWPPPCPGGGALRGAVAVRRRAEEWPPELSSRRTKMKGRRGTRPPPTNHHGCSCPDPSAQ
jgi:hypothetical protein